MDLFGDKLAIFSECGTYRYRLERRLGVGPVALYILVNPSIADAHVDDPTIRKLVGFSKMHGFGRVIVGNKFAYRATQVRKLAEAEDPVGPENDYFLREMAEEADTVIIAWGTLGKLPLRLRQRWLEVVEMIDPQNNRLNCFGICNDRHPVHPLMLPYSARLRPWKVETT